MRARGSIALAAAALALAGCGGGGGEDVLRTGGGPASGAIAPASTELFISLLTDFESDQWKTLEALAERFPSVKTALEDPEFVNGRDAFGPDTGVVALTLEDTQQSAFVGLNQPRDEAKFRTLLEQEDEPSVVEEIEGWQVFANTRDTLDRFKAARNDGSLADDEDFQAAMASLPATRLLTVFVPGAPIGDAYREQVDTDDERLPGLGRLDWLAAAASVRDEGLAVDLRAEGDDVEATSFAPTLIDEVPAGSLAVLSVKGLDEALEEARRNPAVARRLGQGAEFLGETLDKVIALFENEAVLYVRPGAPVPEVTLALAVADEEAALGVVDELLGKIAPLVPQRENVDVDGVAARRLTLENTTLYVAAFDGKLVITSADTGIRGLRDDGARLPDDPLYTDAVEAAEMPDRTAGSLYVNVPALLPLLTALQPDADGAKALEAAAEIGALVAYANVEGSLVSTRLFFAVK